MKSVLLLLAMLLLAPGIHAQSHNYAQCYLNPHWKPNTEGVNCSACRTKLDKEKAMKEAAQKQKDEANMARYKAEREAKQKAFENSRKKMRDESSKSTSGDVLINGQENTGSSSSGRSNSPKSNGGTDAQLRQLGMDPNQDYLGNTVSGAATVIGEMFSEAREKKLQKERVAKQQAHDQKTKWESYFQMVLDKSKMQAEQGNEHDRMKLVYCMENYSIYAGADLSYMLPELNDWVATAIGNNNLDALNLVGYYSFYRLKPKAFNYSINEGISFLEKSASLGSVDAMICLARFYDKKPLSYDGNYWPNGNNAEEALYWFHKAAATGDGTALYYLGMIYRYGRTSTDKGFTVKYDQIQKDAAIALDYFTKSANTKPADTTCFNSHHPISNESANLGVHKYGYHYDQLIEMYERGIGCKKDKAMARRLSQINDDKRRLYLD